MTYTIPSLHVEIMNENEKVVNHVLHFQNRITLYQLP